LPWSAIKAPARPPGGELLFKHRRDYRMGKIEERKHGGRLDEEERNRTMSIYTALIPVRIQRL